MIFLIALRRVRLYILLLTPILMLISYSSCISQMEMRFKIVGKGGEISTYSIGKRYLKPSMQFSSVIPFGKAYSVEEHTLPRSTTFNKSNAYLINNISGYPMASKLTNLGVQVFSLSTIYKSYRATMPFEPYETHRLPPLESIASSLWSISRMPMKTGLLFAFAKNPPIIETSKPIIKQPLSEGSKLLKRHFDPFAYTLFVPSQSEFEYKFSLGGSIPVKTYSVYTSLRARMVPFKRRWDVMSLLTMGRERGRRRIREAFSFIIPKHRYLDRWAVSLKCLKKYHMMPEYPQFISKRYTPSDHTLPYSHFRKIFDTKMGLKSCIHVEGGSIEGQPYILGEIRTMNSFTRLSYTSKTQNMCFNFLGGIVNNTLSLVQGSSGDHYVHIHNSIDSFTGKANAGMSIDVLRTDAFQTSSVGGVLGLEGPSWRTTLRGIYSDLNGWGWEVNSSYRTDRSGYPMYFRGGFGFKNAILVGGMDLGFNLNDFGFGLSLYRKNVEHTPRDSFTFPGTSTAYDDTFSTFSVSLGRAFKDISFSSVIGVRNYDTLHIFTYVPTYSSTTVHSLNVVWGSADVRFDVEPVRISLFVNGEGNSNRYANIHLIGVFSFDAGFGTLVTSNDFAFERLDSTQQVSLITTISSGLKFGGVKIGLGVNNLWGLQQLFSPASLGGTLTLDYEF